MGMSRKEIIALVLVLLATVGAVAGIWGLESYRRSHLFTAELIAREPEYGSWYPQTITVPYGSDVKLLIRNISGVSHGFALPDFRVAVKEIKAGETAVIQFTADKKGTFTFHCTVWCSDRHLGMSGNLVVQ